MRKGHELGKWMPVEIEPLMSDPDMAVWYDEQKWWFLALLFRAWGNVENPCHLPNDPDRLRTLAGVPDSRKRLWATRSKAVLAKFGVSSDGRWISNRKQLEVYANQLARLDARRDAGSKGGQQTASKRAAMLQQSSSSTSLSSSVSDFDVGSFASSKDSPPILIAQVSESETMSGKQIDQEAEFAAGYVLDRLEWTGKDARWTYKDQIAKQLRLGGKSAEAIAEQMVEAWVLYRAASKNFRIKFGISNFFQKGIWCDPSQWGEADQDRGKDSDNAIDRAGERLKSKCGN